MTQRSLFDPPEDIGTSAPTASAPDGLTPFERGMEGSARAARRWTEAEMAQVDEAIRKCHYFLPEFTADDIWFRLPKGFPVTKGLAARLNKAANAGLIEATDRTRKSTRTDEHGHGQRLTVWRSL